jgi:hypothetical protein
MRQSTPGLAPDTSSGAAFRCWPMSAACRMVRHISRNPSPNFPGRQPMPGKKSRPWREDRSGKAVPLRMSSRERSEPHGDSLRTFFGSVRGFPGRASPGRLFPPLSLRGAQRRSNLPPDERPLLVRRGLLRRCAPRNDRKPRRNDREINASNQRANAPRQKPPCIPPHAVRTIITMTAHPGRSQTADSAHAAAWRLLDQARTTPGPEALEGIARRR